MLCAHFFPQLFKHKGQDMHLARLDAGYVACFLELVHPAVNESQVILLPDGGGELVADDQHIINTDMVNIDLDEERGVFVRDIQPFIVANFDKRDGEIQGNVPT